MSSRRRVEINGVKRRVWRERAGDGRGSVYSRHLETPRISHDKRGGHAWAEMTSKWSQSKARESHGVKTNKQTKTKKNKPIDVHNNNNDFFFFLQAVQKRLGRSALARTSPTRDHITPQAIQSEMKRKSRDRGNSQQQYVGESDQK